MGLSIHGLFDPRWHLPLVYGLIPGKTQVLYSDFLSELDSFGGFDPQSVLCDFERGLHNAISSVWPSATIRGCYFSSIVNDFDEHDPMEYLHCIGEILFTS